MRNFVPSLLMVCRSRACALKMEGFVADDCRKLAKFEIGVRLEVEAGHGGGDAELEDGEEYRRERSMEV